MKKAIINNQGVSYVDMTADELSAHETLLAESEAKETAVKNEQAQKEADALAGNNKLLELGLTQAQVTAMTGYKPQ